MINNRVLYGGAGVRRRSSAMNHIGTVRDRRQLQTFHDMARAVVQAVLSTKNNMLTAGLTKGLVPRPAPQPSGASGLDDARPCFARTASLRLPESRELTNPRMDAHRACPRPSRRQSRRAAAAASCCRSQDPNRPKRVRCRTGWRLMPAERSAWVSDS